jgi:hypothetical protein
MKYLATTAIFLLAVASVSAQSPAPTPAPTCKTQATEKKLGGAALKSFMTKCERDATAACDKTAAEKKLSGAAKTSFTKKCLGDAKGG